MPISKGTILNLNLMSRHYDPTQYKEPMKFIPERFDPTSKYYWLPERDNKSRDPFSWVPFSFGIRKCPGQALSITEIKVIVVYLISKVNLNISKDILESDYAYFNIASQLTLDFKTDTQ